MPESIDEVIAALDAIVDQSYANASAAGYFPALYRRVTVAVKAAIEQGKFEDNERMERLDVVFANRYIDACRSYADKGEASRSWRAALERGTDTRLITLQHLLLGMNAHISLDLGIAAATVSDLSRPLALKKDFFAINAILASLIDDTQARLTRIFGPLGLTDRLVGSTDESLSIFSIGYARDKAWTQTLELMLASPAERDFLIDLRDQAVSKFSHYLVRPPKLWTRILLRLIRLLERGDVQSRIQILAED